MQSDLIMRNLDSHLQIRLKGFKFSEPPMDLSSKAKLYGLVYRACSGHVGPYTGNLDSFIEDTLVTQLLHEKFSTT